MMNVDKILTAAVPLGGVGVCALHETAGPAVLFVTTSGKAYRIDFEKAPDDETVTKAAKAIEDATGEKVEWCNPTRAAPERDKAIAEAESGARLAAAEVAKSEPAPVKVQTAEEAQRAVDLGTAAAR